MCELTKWGPKRMTTEMVSNRSNRLTMGVVVFTMALSLTMVSAALLWQGASNASVAQSGNEVTVWMSADADAHEIHAVGAQLARLSYLRRPCAYWNKTRNFAEARKLLPADIWHNATVADMPTSYWCTPVVLADANQIIKTMRDVPGVLTVTIDPANPYRDESAGRH
jgi:cell division protein FtsX